MNREIGWWITGLILTIVLLVGVIFWSRSSHEKSIRDWAKKNEYAVISIERVGMFDNDSPWWRSKDDDLCRVILSDGHRNRTAFSRQRFRGFEQKLKGE